MRIISGIHKGRRLTAPKKLPVRPTTDFAKEALFNILHHRVSFSEISVIDLFAGTGNISYEFASRGCPTVTAVDSHYGCVKYIQETAAQLELPIETIKADAFKYAATSLKKATIFFADPPYSITQEDLSILITSILTRELLNEEGFIIIEHTKHTDLSKTTGFQEARRYGGSFFSFFG